MNARSVDEADTALAAQVWLDSPDVSFIHPLGHEHGFDQAPDARDILKTEAESPRCCRPCLRKFSVGRIRLGLRSKVQESSLAYQHSRKGDSGVLENAGRVAISACPLLRDACHTGATRILARCGTLRFGCEQGIPGGLALNPPESDY